MKRGSGIGKGRRGRRADSPAGRPPGRLVALARRWLDCRRGVSAVEFALIAPALALSLLSTFDLGMGMSERMALDHVLRAGAQKAIEDPGATIVKDRMTATAKLNFPGTLPTLSALRFCACPEAVETAVTCDTNCANSAPTYSYYRLTATKTYSGTFMPAFNFNRTLQIQVR